MCRVVARGEGKETEGTPDYWGIRKLPSNDSPNKMKLEEGFSCLRFSRGALALAK